VQRVARQTIAGSWVYTPPPDAHILEIFEKPSSNWLALLRPVGLGAAGSGAGELSGSACRYRLESTSRARRTRDVEARTQSGLLKEELVIR